MAKADEPPALYVVLESFVADENGAPVLYAKGEVIHPDDVHIKLMPGRFGAFAFPHPLPGRQNFAEKMAEAKAAKAAALAISVPEVRS